MSENVQVTVTTHDDGHFVRTALVIDPGKNGSIVIVDSTGRQVLMLNLFQFKDYFDVDVITEDRGPVTVVAWSDGRQVVRERFETSVTAVLVGM